VVYANGLEDSSEDRWFTYKSNKIYVLFVGVRNKRQLNENTSPLPWNLPFTFLDIRFDNAACLMSKAFINYNNLHGNVAYNKVLTSENHISKDQIISSLNEIKSLQPKPGDNLFIFMTGHGEYSDGIASVKLDSGVLTSYSIDSNAIFNSLNNESFNDINKWVIIDACHSGAFWDKLKDIPLMHFISSQTKDKLAIAISDSQRIKTLYNNFPYSSNDQFYPMVALRVLDALSLDQNGYFKADVDQEGLDFNDLKSYILNTKEINEWGDNVLALELAFGDLSIFNPITDWGPFFNVSFNSKGVLGAPKLCPLPSGALLLLLR
jgi:hypothetical protein